MTDLRVSRALLVASVVITIVTISALRPRHSTIAIAMSPSQPTIVLDRPSGDSLLAASEVISAGDLFRAEREPAPDNAVLQGAATAPYATVRPQLVLRGLIGGPAWQAIIEGIPGVEGAVVLRTGETRDGLTLRAVRRDTAVLTTKDTTWKLTVRRTW